MAVLVNDVIVAQRACVMSNSAFREFANMRDFRGDQEKALKSFVGAPMCVDPDNGRVGLVQSAWRDVKGDVWVSFTPFPPHRDDK